MSHVYNTSPSMGHTIWRLVSVNCILARVVRLGYCCAFARVIAFLFFWKFEKFESWVICIELRYLFTLIYVRLYASFWDDVIEQFNKTNAESQTVCEYNSRVIETVVEAQWYNFDEWGRMVWLYWICNKDTAHAQNKRTTGSDPMRNVTQTPICLGARSKEIGFYSSWVSL